MKCPVYGNNTFDINDYEYKICLECFYIIGFVNNTHGNMEVDWNVMD